MAKKEWTAEERKAFGEKMKAAKAKKAAEASTVAAPPVPEEPEVEEIPQAPATAHNVTEEPTFDNPVEQVAPTPAPVAQALPPVTLTQEQFQMMLDRLSQRPEPQASPEAVKQAFPAGEPPTLDGSGRVMGIIERFPINPSFYKNPVEELYETPELKRFNLRYNWVIEWAVTPTKYQTAMGTWYIEPRFELTLKKKQFDEDNNELIKYDDRNQPYHPRIVWGRASFFEDPPANLLEAELAGLTMDDVDSPDFQEKMRMYRYKFWLIEKVSPKAPKFTTSNRREEVIGGKAYEIDNSSMPI